MSESSEYLKDYIALKEIWEALDGPNWSYAGEVQKLGINWNFNKDIDLWGEQPGVQLHSDGRIASITIEDFGGNEIAISSVPLDLYGQNEKDMFLSLLDELCNEVPKGRQELVYEKMASMACKAAVKGNMRMSKEEVKTLLAEMMELDNPYNCPHGRPTIISMTKYELEKKFKRIV